MQKLSLWKVLAITMLVIFTIICVLCGLIGQNIYKSIDWNGESKESQNFKPKYMKRGLTISPKSFGIKDYSDFYDIASDFEYIAWYGDWIELGDSTKTAYSVVRQAKQKNLKSVIAVQVFTQQTGKLLRPFNDENNKLLMENIKKFILESKPDYLGIGIEINILQEKNPSDYQKFVTVFKDLIQYIHSLGSETKLFTIFQLEKMKGLNGGLFGGKNDSGQNQWKLLDDFRDVDLYAFTTYPYLIYDSPNDIPKDYYTEIFVHSNKNIGFTEIGWSSSDMPNGWRGSEDEQDLFVQKILEKNVSSKTSFYIWSFLYDQAGIPQVFVGNGLFDSRTNQPKKAWQRWTGEI